MRTFRNGLILFGVVSVALLPLFGDPRPSAIVSHAEWARMLLRGLDLLVDVAGVNDTAEQAFATLSGRDSRGFAADGYVRANRVEVVADGASKLVRPTGGIGEAVYAMAVAQPGDYRLRFLLGGPANAETELTKAGDNVVLRRFTLTSSPAIGWVDAGLAHLDPGAYHATVLLPEGSSLQYVEIAPPCLHSIEPAGGWKTTSVATGEDVAVTTLQALDLESELPPSGTPIEFRSADLQLADGTPAGAGEPFRAPARGTQVLLVADLPESGLYTLSALGATPGGQRWIVDGCRSCVVCPSTDPTRRWHPILSGLFQKGRHVFAATLGPDTLIERLRLEPRKATPADYVGTLNRLGLDVGASGPVSREKADEARRFLSRRRAELFRQLCGDILRAGTLVAELAATGSGAASSGGSGESGGKGGPVEGPAAGEGGGGEGGGGGGPGPPPIVPPLPPPSPTLPVGFERD